MKQIYSKIDTTYMGTCNEFEANLKPIKKETEANFSAIHMNFVISEAYYTDAKLGDIPKSLKRLSYITCYIMSSTKHVKSLWNSISCNY